jgi:hypothetical protein
MKNTLVLLAIVALAVPAAAQTEPPSDSATLQINSIVDDYVVISETEDLDVQTPISGIDLAGDESQRARFTVTANSSYDLTITAGQTFYAWDNASYQQVAFVSDSGEFHGGSIFLDPTPGQQVPGNNDLIRWDGNTGQISADIGQPGTTTWGIGGELLPSLTDVEGEIVPAGTYTATLTVEASIN